MSRYIDIEMVEPHQYENSDVDLGVLAYDYEEVQALPFFTDADFEPERGEWIEHKGKTIVGDNNFIDFFPTEYECSNCGLRQTTYFINSTLPNFCPNCGCAMTKEGE